MDKEGREMMDSYYINLSREGLQKAIATLVSTQDYMIRAGLPDYQHKSIARIISGLQNRVKEMGVDLKISKKQ